MTVTEIKFHVNVFLYQQNMIASCDFVGYFNEMYMFKRYSLGPVTICCSAEDEPLTSRQHNFGIDKSQ